jgi:hypothetical protein
VRRLDGLLQILPAASARVDKPASHELLHGSAICRQTFALTHLSVPFDVEPAEILAHGLREIRSRALRVEILIPKPQHSSCSASTLSRDPECPRMSEVQ